MTLHLASCHSKSLWVGTNVCVLAPGVVRVAILSRFPVQFPFVLDPLNYITFYILNAFPHDRCTCSSPTGKLQFPGTFGYLFKLRLENLVQHFCSTRNQPQGCFKKDVRGRRRVCVGSKFLLKCFPFHLHAPQTFCKHQAEIQIQGDVYKDGGKPNMLQQAFNKPAQRRGDERNGGMGVVMLQGS